MTANNIAQLLHVLRRHYRLSGLDWTAPLCSVEAFGLDWTAPLRSVEASARLKGRGITIIVYPDGCLQVVVYGSDVGMGTSVMHRVQHATVEDAINAAPSVAAWAVEIAAEGPCDDDALSDAIGQRRLNRERRALLSKPDRTPEEEERLEAIREEIGSRWRMFETDEDRESRDLLNRFAAHLKALEASDD